jgi:hypothetical protein
MVTEIGLRRKLQRRKKEIKEKRERYRLMEGENEIEGRWMES